MTLQKKLVTAIATGAVVMNAMAPFAFADTTIQISGNGTNSDNNANVKMDQSTTVSQSNDAKVTNDVKVDANTGGNSAKDNTGGDVSIKTGDATVKTQVSNALNTNVASVDCCPKGDTNVLIGGNGSYSDNKVKLNNDSQTNVFQNNNADVTNNVTTNAKTGDNDAKDNTGGDVSIKTGDAYVTTKVSTAANANSASVGQGDRANGGDLSLKILGNGTKSDNDIYFDNDSSVTVSQDNYADVYNKVKTDANTGDNSAKDNTGGDVYIGTGDAYMGTEVDNMVNFNWADVNCGCLFSDVLAKVDGNGSNSDNKIDAKLSSNNGEKEGTFQLNDAYLTNKLDQLKAKTGDNKNSDNTAWNGAGDPSIKTGDTASQTKVENSGNVNVDGKNGPDLPVDIQFNFNDLMSLFSLLH